MSDRAGNIELTPAAPDPGGPKPTTDEQLKALLLGDAEADNREAVDALVTSLLGPTAKVVLPRQEDMVLHLVSEQAIRRLDDTRSTSRFLWTVVATAVGGIVGFLTNVLTGGGDIDTLAWAFLAVLAVAAIGTGVYAGIVSRRERALLKSILGEGS